MTAMDVKGVSWVGHMCQRFEALCVDVDEAIYEDTFIYVGNQMRTVGESVKKFYSDVVQDLLSSSSLDSAKGKDALNTDKHIDGATACKKQALDSGSESVETASETTGYSSDDAANAKKSAIRYPCSSTEEPSTPVMFHDQTNNSVSNKSSTAKSDLHTGQHQEDQLELSCDVSSRDSVKEFICNDSLNERDEVFSRCVDTASIEASAAGTLESKKDNVKTVWDMSEENSSALAEEGTQTNETCTELDNSESSVKAASDITVTDNVLDAVEVDTVFDTVCLACDSDTETSRCWLDGETRTAAVDEQECLKLEDSCVLVENDVHFLTVENAQKSYKKKFKAVFSPRKWAKPRRDQDKFSGKHGKQTGKSTEIRNSVSLDSEWELL